MPQEKSEARANASSTAQHDFKVLREQGKDVAQRDAHLGRVLDEIIVRLAQAHGVDLNKEEGK